MLLPRPPHRNHKSISSHRARIVSELDARVRQSASQFGDADSPTRPTIPSTVKTASERDPPRGVTRETETEQQVRLRRIHQ